MTVAHVKSITVADGTNTNIVRPGDWNSNHNFYQTITGNTAGQSTASGTNLLFGGTNGISLSLSTGAGVATMWFDGGRSAKTYYNLYENIQSVVSQQNASLYLRPMVVDVAVQHDRLMFPVLVTNSSNSSGSQTISVWAGIYTKNGSTLSLVSSVLGTLAMTQSGTVGSYSILSGIRNMTVGWTNTILPGDYYFGLVSRTTSGGTNASISNLYASNLASGFSGILGASSPASAQMFPGFGYYSATTAGMPNSVAFSDIQGSNSIAQRPPIAYLVSSPP